MKVGTEILVTTSINHFNLTPIIMAYDHVY